MTEHRDIIQETLERIRSGKKPENMVKKRRLSRVILLVDILIIVLILVFIYKRAPEKLYLSTTLSFKELNYRISLSHLDNKKDYLFSITIENTLNKTYTARYIRNIADLEIYYKETVLYKSSIGGNTQNLELPPHGLKTFILKLNTNIIEEFIKIHPEYIIARKQNLFSSSRGFVPFKAVITINQGDKISAPINFNHEVE